MRHVVSLLVGALMLGGCAAAPSMPPLTDRTQEAGQGSQGGAPLSFRVTRYPGGEPYDFASERGNVVLLDVWATWCEPCRDALPTYEALAREYGPKGLKVYALNVDEDPRAIAPFLQETKVTLPILQDANAQVAERTLKVRVMPTSFLIDRRGVVRHVREGFAEDFLQLYQTEIEELLAEPAKR
ncbi:TlpA family protein disulfide reductase [Myxococcaceae bacterium JPH2]|nr:TlpA family protein disulfide reductase [Myxococcaceae bacterium JPH2]